MGEDLDAQRSFNTWFSDTWSCVVVGEQQYRHLDPLPLDRLEQRLGRAPESMTTPGPPSLVADQVGVREQVRCIERSTIIAA